MSLSSQTTMRHFKDLESFKSLTVKCKRGNCPYKDECLHKDGCLKEPQCPCQRCFYLASFFDTARRYFFKTIGKVHLHKCPEVAVLSGLRITLSFSVFLEKTQVRCIFTHENTIALKDITMISLNTNTSGVRMKFSCKI